ncbi:MAG: hypothetical protein GOV15_01770, partial [Candidatus Diapherotrites archaeon]|nr:hypothetical protein [Candidatus Diapherotrites archaeon]
HLTGLTWVDKQGITSTTLVVDDLVGTGATLERIISECKTKGFNPLTAVIYYKTKSSVKPDFYAIEMVSDEDPSNRNPWIVFPWEAGGVEDS